MKIVVTPTRAWTSFSSKRISSRRRASRLENGSSSNRTSGSLTSARPSATRCCWPPESRGAGRSCRPSRPRLCSIVMTLSRISAGGSRLPRSGKAIFSKTFMCGQIAYDWNTMPIRRLSGGNKMPCSTDVTSRSPTRTSPASGRSSPAIMRSVVVLPQPLGPSRVSIEPLSTSKLTSSTAGTLPKSFRRPATRMVVIGFVPGSRVFALPSYASALQPEPMLPLPLQANFAASAGTCLWKQELLTNFCASHQTAALRVKRPARGCS